MSYPVLPGNSTIKQKGIYMSNIYDILSEKIRDWRVEAKEIMETGADKVISEVTVSQAYGGMRGIVATVCDTSWVPQDIGLIIRGKKLKDVVHITPRDVFFLMLTGEFPDEESLTELSREIRKRKIVPEYVWDVIRSLPKDSHPMTMFNTAILAMQRESVFAKRYDEGLKKEDYWIPTLEDALNIIAKLPAIAAFVYRYRFGKGDRIEPDMDMDFTWDFVHQIGLEQTKEFYDLMRIYFVAHCDHEGCNVSAFATQTINSALSDLYYSISGGLNGLAGPLHGLANQESLKWILSIMERFGGTPSEEQIRELFHETLQSGKVIPGYGHAVLRVTDPRFEVMVDFGKKHCPEDPIFKTVTRVFDVVPDELKKIEKIKNPWPNVDAASGALLHHYGITEFSYYTVLFAVSRTLGLAAQAVIYRAMMNPLIRPKSVTTDWIKAAIKK
jgi:citrate synthase